MKNEKKTQMAGNPKLKKMEKFNQISKKKLAPGLQIWDASDQALKPEQWYKIGTE